MPRMMRFGDILIDSGLVTNEELSQALDEQKRTKEKIGDILVRMNFITQDQLIETIAEQYDMPIFSKLQLTMQPNIAIKLPKDLATETHALLLTKESGELIIGMTDPLDSEATDKLILFFDDPFKITILTEQDFKYYFHQIYEENVQIRDVAGELNEKLKFVEKRAENEGIIFEEDLNVSNAPVVRLLNMVFERAIELKASDVHIESDDKFLRIRYRVDGVLIENELNELEILPALVMRLKILSNLNIAENRLPQDGRFSVTIRNHLLDIRLATTPSLYGESVVMRILDKSAGLIDLDKIGMDKDDVETLKKYISYPNGIILVTGPTGSGKTTTLYAALNMLNSSEKKIITVEDPVEYELKRITQIQVNEKIDLSFSKALRSIMRLDPDIILIGEMRDHETAQIGIRAAMTGHLVFSTLHTNDAPSSITRLIDLDISPFLIGDTVRCIMAQRLVRLACPKCSKPIDINAADKEWIQKWHLAVENLKFIQVKGCETCHESGYIGRVGVFEFLEINDELIGYLRKKNPSAFMEKAYEMMHGHRIIDKALKLAGEGKTTLEEVRRVVSGV